MGILARYRKCKSDEVLVVYGKIGGDKKSAKLYYGGAAFIWPIIQGYEFLSMKPKVKLWTKRRLLLKNIIHPEEKQAESEDKNDKTKK